MKTRLVGLVVAMKDEAEGFIAKHELKEETSNGLVVYTGEVEGVPVVLVISGVGMNNAQNATWFLQELGVTEIVNFGTCGSTGNHKVGEVVLPNVLFNGDFDLSMMDQTTKDPANVNDIMKVSRLVHPVHHYTYSTFITDKRANGCSVDMEAYGVASACNVFGTKYIICKCVSDGADEEALKSFDANVKNVVDLNEAVIRNLIVNFDECHDKIYKEK